MKAKEKQHEWEAAVCSIPLAYIQSMETIAALVPQYEAVMIAKIVVLTTG